jgi:hypothetical protein
VLLDIMFFMICCRRICPLCIWALIYGDSPPSTVSTFTRILSNEYKLITTGDDTSVFVIKQKENPYNSMEKVVK